MAAPISIDIVFVVMLGAGIWASIQLNQAAAFNAKRMSLGRLSQVAVVEGLVCAAVWYGVMFASQRVISTELLVQSGIVGAVWAAFTFASRVPFQSLANVSE
jgi:hypothetical protein